MIKKKICEETGNVICYIEDEKLHVARSYTTLDSWYDDSHLLTLRLENLTDKKGRLVLTNIETGVDTDIDMEGIVEQYTVNNGKVYCMAGDRINMLDIKSGERSSLLIEEGLGECRGYGMSNDGKMLAGTWRDKELGNVIRTVDLTNGEVKKIASASFFWPYEEVTHCMINPENKEQIFYCHEGHMTYITNRLWLLDVKSGKAVNCFKHNLDENGANIEHCGHEMWDYSGEGMYFIMYVTSIIEPKGVYYLDAKTMESKHIGGKYPYWHVGVGRNSTKLTLDTQQPGDFSDVVYMDLKSGEERKIARCRTNWVHPTHPHPAFSPSEGKIAFSMLNDDGKLCAGWVEV